MLWRIDRNNDFGSGFDGAGKITWIGVHIIDNHCFTRCDCGSAYALGDRDAHMRSWVADKWAEDQCLGIAGINHVEAGPVVMREASGDGFHDALL
jgi:hypothetical protein